MQHVDLVLDIAALVCFCLAVGNVPARINLVALGLAFWVATTIF